MCVTNRKEVEINMLKQPTIDKRLQESQDVSVLVFSEQYGKKKETRNDYKVKLIKQGMEDKHTWLCYPAEWTMSQEDISCAEYTTT